MIVNRDGDFFRLALRACVQAADNALQIREFLHHFAGKIALGQFRCAYGSAIAAQFPNQRRDTIGLLFI